MKMSFLFRVLYALVQWTLLIPIKVLWAATGLVAVLFSIAGDGWKRTPWLWKWWADAERTPEPYNTRWGVYWYWAIRNPGGPPLKQPESYTQYGFIDETTEGFNWRWRHTKWLDSFRVAWGATRPAKGKKEFYIGWKMDKDAEDMHFTLQFRPW